MQCTPVPGCTERPSEALQGCPGTAYTATPMQNNANRVAFRCQTGHASATDASASSGFEDEDWFLLLVFLFRSFD